MYNYFLCDGANEELNKEYINMVKNKFPSAVITDSLVDVDESKITIFNVGGKKIKLITDYRLNEITIDSEIELKLVKLN